MSRPILIEPLVTEKSLNLVKKGSYTFRVARTTHKRQIAAAVESTFGVDVVAVQTMSMHGKTKRAGKIRKEVKRQPWKKAVVTIKKGQKIDVVAITPDGVEKKK